MPLHPSPLAACPTCGVPLLLVKSFDAGTTLAGCELCDVAVEWFGRRDWLVLPDLTRPVPAGHPFAHEHAAMQAPRARTAK